MATHSSILAWRILWIEAPGTLQFMGLQESDTLPQPAPSGARTLEAGKRWARLARARAASRPGTPVFLSGESHGQRSLAGYSPQGHKELDMTELTAHACMHHHSG